MQGTGGYETGCPLRTQPGALVLLCNAHLKPSKATRPGTLHGSLLITRPFVLIDPLTNPFLSLAKYNWPDLGAFIEALFSACGGANQEGPEQAGARATRTRAHTQRHRSPRRPMNLSEQPQGLHHSVTCSHTPEGPWHWCSMRSVVSLRQGLCPANSQTRRPSCVSAPLTTVPPPTALPSVSGHCPSKEGAYRGGDKPRPLGGNGTQFRSASFS